MTREEHIAWLKAIRDSISGGDEEFDNKRRESLDAGISALSQISDIKAIINNPMYIQEDVLRYQMICEVVKE